ncbi:hypothetical protein GW796_08085 [archaeon]|nr:hypothetical protein [archaeon]
MLALIVTIGFSNLSWSIGGLAKKWLELPTSMENLKEASPCTKKELLSKYPLNHVITSGELMQASNSCSDTTLSAKQNSAIVEK